MKEHEFYQFYANIPIIERERSLITTQPHVTWHWLYRQIHGKRETNRQNERDIAVLLSKAASLLPLETKE